MVFCGGSGVFWWVFSVHPFLWFGRGVVVWLWFFWELVGFLVIFLCVCACVCLSQQCKISELWPPENEVHDGNQVTLNYEAEKLICPVTGEKAADRSLSLMGPQT